MPASIWLQQSNVSISSFGCGSTHNGSRFNGSLKIRELCSTVQAGNSTLCVGDYSGSPLVCGDGVLTGLLLTRTRCSAGSVYKFANVAHALQWLRSDRAEVHYILINDSSRTRPTTTIAKNIPQNSSSQPQQEATFTRFLKLFAIPVIALVIIPSIVYFIIVFVCAKMLPERVSSR